MVINKETFICFNGDILPNRDLFTLNNRSFKYGDGLFETMRTRGARILFFEHHWKRLINSMLVLQMDVNSLPEKAEIESIVSRLLHRNKYLKAARLRFTVYRNSGGFYAPTNDTVSYTIEATPLTEAKYELNTKGILVGLYDQIPIVPNALSSLKTCSALQYIMAAKYCKTKRYDDCILLNQNGYIVEGTASNIFLLIQDKLITPPIADGCIDGIMRGRILEIANSMSLETVTNKHIDPKHLESAEEVFLTNTIHGLKWVMGHKNKRYFNKKTREITNILNQNTGLND